MAPDCFGLVHLPTYLIGTAIVVMLPGPNSLFVLSTAVRHGARIGYRAACGVFIGDAVLMTLASMGTASLLQTNPGLFTAFKLAGAAYLAWIGIGMLVAGRRPVDAIPPSSAASGSTNDGLRPLTRALTVSLLNPKAILFFMAFFIQFVDRRYAHPALSFALLGLMAQTISFLYLSTLIFGGARVADAFRRRQRLAAGLRGSVGALFLGFSAKLATATVN
jgi:leucine efflux protein